MKKFLKDIALFIPILLLGHSAFICVLGEVAPNSSDDNLAYKLSGGGHMFTRTNEARKISDLDILFIGTSHIYRGIDTRIFENAGYKAFNLGSSIQTPLQTEVLLERYLDSLNPKLVVYDVNPVIFESDGVESALDIISNDGLDLRALKMAFKINHPKVYNTLIFSFYRQFFGLNTNRREPAVQKDDMYIPGGYVQKKPSKFEEYADPVPSDYTILDKQWKAFENVISIYRRKNIPFVLVRMPINMRLHKSKTNNDYFNSLMAGKGRFYDFTGKLELNDTVHFFDSNHLNTKGVQIFNRYLVDVIKNDKLAAPSLHNITNGKEK